MRLGIQYDDYLHFVVFLGGVSSKKDRVLKGPLGRSLLEYVFTLLSRFKGTNAFLALTRNTPLFKFVISKCLILMNEIMSSNLVECAIKIMMM